MTPSPTSVSALQADIAARRARLAETVDELSRRATPQALMEQQKEVARTKFVEFTHTPDGELRRDRVAAAVAVVVAFLALRMVNRRRRRRR